jgi:hypothetical protein
VRDRLNAQDATISSWWRRLGYGGPMAGVVALSGFVWLWISVTGKVQTGLNNEFGTAHIRGLIDAAAQRAAVDQLRPQVEEAKALVDQVKANVDAALVPIRHMEEVLQLQARAAALSRKAFDQLHEMAETADDPELRTLAMGFYRTIDGANQLGGWGDPPDSLVSTADDGTTKKGVEISTDRLCKYLCEGDARRRALAAEVLGAKHDLGAVAFLVSLIRAGSEPHLWSLGVEVRALASIVPDLGQALSSPFDSGGVIRWWAQHEHDFPSGSCQPPIEGGEAGN